MNRRQALLGVLLAPLIKPIAAMLPKKKISLAINGIYGPDWHRWHKAYGLMFMQEYELMRWDRYGIFHQGENALFSKRIDALKEIHHAGQEREATQVHGR